MIEYWTQIYNILKEERFSELNEGYFILDKDYDKYSLSLSDFPSWFKLKIPIQGLIFYDKISLKQYSSNLSGVEEIGMYNKISFRKDLFRWMGKEDFIDFCFKKLYENLKRERGIRDWMIKSKRSKEYLNHWGLVSAIMTDENKYSKDTIDIIKGGPEENIKDSDIYYRFRIAPWNDFLMIYSPRYYITTYCKIRSCIHKADIYEQLSYCC